jgi:hypothetical protein
MSALKNRLREGASAIARRRQKRRRSVLKIGAREFVRSTCGSPR